jgi:3-hydroxyisobutyrate dehydrogenase-like beta-hydroxyacid dehydrogenase
MKVGFIGLGAMGSGIAANIIAAGHQVVAWNRSPEPLHALVAKGATPAGAPVETLAADCLFTMLANDDAFRDLGLDGSLLDRAAHGLVHVNLATISVAFAHELHESHARRRLGYVASPVFGRPEVAAAGKLTVVAAGAAKDIDRVRPILEKIGARFAVVGDKPVQANLFKIAGNFMIASAIETLGEAVALLRKGGVDPATFVDVLTNGLFAAPVYQIYGKIIVERKFEPPGFKLNLGLKDAGLTLAAANALDAPLPLASVVHDHFVEARAAGWGDKDWSSLARFAAARAGLKD